MTWQIELVKRYPSLFRRASDPDSVSGYPAVGDGWQVTVERAVGRIDAAVGTFLKRTNAHFHIVQIKEKLGGLRIYIDHTGLTPMIAAKVEEAIDLAEARASCTCELCGAIGRLYDRAGWYLTRCERHAEGEPVADQGDPDVYVRFVVKDGKMRVSRCRRYDREHDIFVDASLPDGEFWAEEK